MQQKQVCVLVKAYRTSLLRNIRLQHESAADWLKFFCSQDPIRSNDLKETLFFLLLERFDRDDDELIQYVEQHTPYDMKRDSTLTLNPDMAFLITQYLDSKSVIAFASTCKRVKSLIEVSGDEHGARHVGRGLGTFRYQQSFQRGFFGMTYFSTCILRLIIFLTVMDSSLTDWGNTCGRRETSRDFLAERRKSLIAFSMRTW